MDIILYVYNLKLNNVVLANSSSNKQMLVRGTPCVASKGVGPGRRNGIIVITNGVTARRPTTSRRLNVSFSSPVLGEGIRIVIRGKDKDSVGED